MRSKNTDLMNEIKKFAEGYYLEYWKSPSTSEIAGAVGVTRATVYRYLKDMAERGMIDYDGSEIRTDVTRKYTDPGNNAVILDCSVSCGIGLPEEERVLEYVKLPKTVFGTGDLFLLKANGDSMVDAGIEDGDWIVVRKQTDANEGDIVVALFEGLNNLKYFYWNKKKNCAVLRSANKAKGYKDIEVYDLQIQGVAQNVIKGL